MRPESPPSLIPPKGNTAALLKACAWFVLASTYLAASALGQRPLALAVVGLMIGVVIIAMGRSWLGLAVGALLGAGAIAAPASIALLAYTPPLAAFAFMSWFFGRTLRTGSVPLIARIAKVEHPELPAELASHALLLTWMWALCFAALFVAALVLIPLVTLEIWSRSVQCLGYVVPALLFIGEHIYRKVALGHYPHTALPVMVRNVFIVMKAEAAEVAARDAKTGPL